MLVDLDHSTQIYKDKDLVNGMAYTYHVTAFNDFGESDLSEEVTGTPATIPSKPLAIDAQPGNSEIEISWTAPTDNGGAPINGHIVLRKEGDGEYLQLVEVAAGETTYTDAEIRPGATYSYNIRTRNRMGLSLEGEEVTVVAQGPPGPPVDLIIVPGDGSISLTWGSPINNGGSEITGYTIYRSDPELESLLILDEVGPETISYEDAQVTNGENYIYQVSAVNAFGESFSNWSQAYQPLGTPGAPTSISLVSEDDAITISWSVPDEDGGCCIEFYRIYRTTEDGEMKEIGLVGSDRTTFVDDSRKDVGKYTYVVIAVNDVGDGQTGAQDTIEVSGSKDDGSFVGNNIGLFITVPIIVILLVLLALLLTRRSKTVQNVEPTPVSSTPEEYPDMSGYFNGYPEQEQMGAGDQPPQLNNVQDYEQ
jgi:titin